MPEKKLVLHRHFSRQSTLSVRHQYSGIRVSPLLWSWISPASPSSACWLATSFFYISNQGSPPPQGTEIETLIELCEEFETPEECEVCIYWVVVTTFLLSSIILKYKTTKHLSLQISRIYNMRDLRILIIIRSVFLANE